MQSGTLGKRFRDVYVRVKHERWKNFLRNIGSVSDEMSDAQRQQFEAFLDSEDGQELLTDFADRVVKTRSRTAIAALAILYSDPVLERYGSDFKAEAAQGLEGISERSIHTFLVLYAYWGGSNRHPQRETSRLDNTIVAGKPFKDHVEHDAQTWGRIFKDLITRDILGADIAPGQRYSQKDAAWEQLFNFTEHSHLYWSLFCQARKALGLPPVGES
jgi:hypothetical protein